jgi:HEAT repeat protein
LKDPNADVRKNAILSLSFFPENSATSIPQIISALNDPDIEVAKAAAVALGRIGAGSDQVEQALSAKYAEATDTDLKRKLLISLVILGKVDERLVPEVAAGLDTNRTADVEAVFMALNKLSAKVEDLVTEQIKKTIATKRDPGAENALNYAKSNPKLFKAISADLFSEYSTFSPKDRFLIFRTAVRTSTKPEDVLALLDKAADDDDPQVRAAAIDAIPGFLRAITDFSILAKALRDKDPGVRQTAIRVVSGLGTKSNEFGPQLLELTKDDDLGVKTTAIGSLGRLTSVSPEMIKRLDESSSDPNPQIRLAALVALHSVGIHQPDSVKSILQRDLKSETDARAKEYIMAILTDLGERFSVTPAPPRKTKKGLVPGEELGGR